MFRTDTLSASTRQVLGAMSNALERGVKVGVLFDVSDNKSDSTTKYNMHTGKILEKAGASVVYDDPDRRLHTKMCVIDREISYIGSHNYTFSGMEKNSEVSVRVRSKDMAREALEYLESRGLK